MRAHSLVLITLMTACSGAPAIGGPDARVASDAGRDAAPVSDAGIAMDAAAYRGTRCREWLANLDRIDAGVSPTEGVALIEGDDETARWVIYDLKGCNPVVFRDEHGNALELRPDGATANDRAFAAADCYSYNLVENAVAMHCRVDGASLAGRVAVSR